MVKYGGEKDDLIALFCYIVSISLSVKAYCVVVVDYRLITCFF